MPFRLLNLFQNNSKDIFDKYFVDSFIRSNLHQDCSLQISILKKSLKALSIFNIYIVCKGYVNRIRRIFIQIKKKLI